MTVDGVPIPRRARHRVRTVALLAVAIALMCGLTALWISALVDASNLRAEGPPSDRRRAPPPTRTGLTKQHRRDLTTQTCRNVTKQRRRQQQVAQANG